MLTLCTAVILNIFTCFMSAENFGADMPWIEDKVMTRLDIGGIDQRIKDMFPDSNISFGEMFWNAITGKNGENLKTAFDSVVNGIKKEWSGLAGIFVSILTIGIVSALFSNIAGVFENKQTADMSFHLIYLLLIIILIRTFAWGYGIAAELISNIIVLMKAMIPAYFVTVGFATGEATAVTFYQFILVLILGAESIVASFMMPLAYSYIYLSMINGLMPGDRLEGMLDIIKNAVSGVLKFAIGTVTGIGILQSMIVPVIDTLKTSAVQKAIGMIPGVGNISSSVTQMVFGSALLVKNSVGVVMMIILIIVCAVPVIKIFLMASILKIASAIIGIVSDKRMVSCTARTGDGTYMLVKMAMTVMALFIITIAIVVVSANRKF